MISPSIREKIEALRVIHTNAVFRPGTVANFAPSPPVKMEEVVACERALGAPLPVDYVKFITTVGNGGYFGKFYMFPLQDAHKYTVCQPFTYDPATYVAKDDGYDFPEDASLNGCIGLADYGCGSFAVLVLLGPEQDFVWEFWGAADMLWHRTGKRFNEWIERWLDFEIARNRAR